MPAVTTSLPILADAAAGNGCFGISPEVDGIIRRVPLLFSLMDPDTGQRVLYPSLALEAIRVAQGEKTIVKIRALDPKAAEKFRHALADAYWPV